MASGFDLSDVKIPISVDYSAAERDGYQWASSFVKGAKAGLGPLGGSLLGNMGQPTGVAFGGGTGDGAVVSWLSKIHGVLVTSLQAQAMMMSGGGAGGGGPPGAGTTISGAPIDEGPSFGGPRRHSRFSRAASMIGDAAGSYISAAGSIADAGGNYANSARVVANFLNQIPIVGKAFGAVADRFAVAFEKQDKFLEAELTRAQVGGIAGQQVDERGAGQYAANMRIGSGIGIDEYSSMYGNLLRSGAIRETSPNLQTNLADIIQMQTGLGSAGGDAYTRLLGAAGRSGTNLDTDAGRNEVLGSALSLAFQEGISKARVPELMDQLASALSDNTTAQADVKDTANRLLMVSQLGPQYVGNTPAARVAEQAMGQIGGTSYDRATAMLGAGLGQGVGPAEAWFKSQVGVGKKGGITTEALLQAQIGQWASTYAAAGDDEGRFLVVRAVARMTGKPAPYIKDVLDGMMKGPFKKIDVNQGVQELQNLQPQDRNKLLRPRVQGAQGEDNWRFGTGTVHGQGGQSMSDYVRGVVNSLPQQGGPTAGGGSQFSSDAVMANQAFLDSWKNVETRGADVGVGDTASVRGFGQINREEAANIGITSDEDFRRLSTDPEFSKAALKKLAGYYAGVAGRDASSFGLNWSTQDMLHLTKLEHGGIASAKNLLQSFKKDKGRAPASWKEFFDAERGRFGGYGSALENADKINVEGGTGYGPGYDPSSGRSVSFNTPAMDVNVYVYDNRVAVVKGGGRKPVGVPGTLGTRSRVG